MFSVFAMLCLSSMPDACREVMIPAPDTSAAVCAAAPETAVQNWLGTARGAVSCREAQGGLSYQEIAPGVYVHIGQIGLPSPENLGDLSHVFLGHMHPDHIYGANVFAEAGARVVGHPNLQEAMAVRAENYAQSLSRLIGPAGFLGSAVPQVDETVDETGDETGDLSQKFDLGGRILEARSLKTAHTNTDLVVIDPSTGTLFASDLVFLVHTPALDGSLRGWQSVLKDLEALPVKQVVPGHGPVTGFPRALRPTQGYLDALAASTKAQLDAGVSLSEAAPLIGQSQRENWELFDEFNTRNATGAYAEMEWE